MGSRCIGNMCNLQIKYKKGEMIYVFYVKESHWHTTFAYKSWRLVDAGGSEKDLLYFI